jgi:hypothetical protein
MAARYCSWAAGPGVDGGGAELHVTGYELRVSTTALRSALLDRGIPVSGRLQRPSPPWAGFRPALAGPVYVTPHTPFFQPVSTGFFEWAFPAK